MSPTYALELEGSAEAGLSGDILAHAASPGCTWTAATSRWGSLAFLNLDTGEALDGFEDSYGDIWGVAVSASGQSAVTVAAPVYDDFVEWFLGVWDVPSARHVARYDLDRGCYRFAATPDLDVIAANGGGRLIWRQPLDNTPLGTADRRNRGQLGSHRLALSDDGRLCAAASPTTATIWDVARGEPVADIALPKKRRLGRKRNIGSLCVTEQHVYYGSNDGQVWRTDLSGGDLECVVDTGHNEWVLALDVHGESGLAAVVLFGERLELWDVNTRRMELAIDTLHDERVTDVRIKANLSRVVTAGKDGCARAWSLRR